MVQDHSAPVRDISVTVMLSYVEVTFSILSPTENGGGQFRVIRGEPTEAVHLYIPIASTLLGPQETLDKYLSVE